MSVWLARVVEVLFWWAACLGVWLVSLSAISGQDLLVSVLVSLPCAAAAVVGRIVAKNRWGFNPAWLRAAAVLPLAIVNDAVQVVAQVLRSPLTRGEFVSVPVRDASGTTARADGRATVATFLATMTPSSIVTDIDPETGNALVHVIRIRGPHMEEVAAR